MMGHDLKEEKILMNWQIINQNFFAGTTIPKVKKNLHKAPSMQNASLYMHCSINLKNYVFSVIEFGERNQNKKIRRGGENKRLELYTPLIKNFLNLHSTYMCIRGTCSPEFPPKRPRLGEFLLLRVPSVQSNSVLKFNR